MKMKKILKIGLIWYAVTLILYGVLLYTFREYEVLSAFYQISLLFPLLLVALKRETFKSLGFRKGVIDASALLLTLGLPFFYIITQIFVLQETIYITLGYALFSCVIVAPIVEEIFFRGFLQEKFSFVLKNKFFAIGLTAVLYGCIHIPRSVGMYHPIGIGFTIILGCLFGWVYSEGKSLIYPIVFHSLYNLTVILIN